MISKRLSMTVLMSLALTLILSLSSFASEKVKISYAHWGNNPGYQAKVEAFNAMQDRIEVEFVPRRMDVVEIIGGVGADAYTLWGPNIHQYALSGFAHSLEAFYQRDADFFRDVFPPAMEAVTVRGEVWALPHYLSGENGLWYNKTRFAEAGLSVPDHSWTWDDEYAAGQKLVRRNPDGEITQWAFLNSTTSWSQLLVRVLTAGGEFLTESGQFAFGGEAGIRAANALIEFARLQDGVGPGNFVRGDVAMGGHAIYYQEPIRTNRMYENFEVGATIMSRDPVTGNRSVEVANNMELIVMNPNTQYPEETWEFMKFMLSQESHDAVYSRIGYIQMIPAKHSVANSPVFLDQDLPNFTLDLPGFLESWANAKSIHVQNWGDVTAIINAEWAKTLAEEQPVEAFYERLQDLVPPIMGEVE